MDRLRAEFQQQGMTPGQAAKAADLLARLAATLNRLMGDTAGHTRR
jgi:hypothetical protein